MSHEDLARLLCIDRGVSDEQTLLWLAKALSSLSQSVAEQVYLAGAFNTHKLNVALGSTDPFNLIDILRAKHIQSFVEALSDWSPKWRGASTVGGVEALLLLGVDGARLSSRGDIWIPDVGHIEVKSTTKKSHVCLAPDGMDEAEARVAARSILKDEGFDFSSFARRNLGTMREILPKDRFISVVCKLFSVLTLGRKEMNPACAELISDCDEFDDVLFYGPLVADAFARLQEKRRFDRLLIVRRSNWKSISLKDEYDFLHAVANKTVTLDPSGLGFKSHRATSIGLRVA